MPTYKFKEANSKIKLNGKWYNESNLDNTVVSEMIKYKPSLLGSVFIEIEETIVIIANEIIEEPEHEIKNEKLSKKKSLS